MRFALLAAALLMAGCATTYQLAVMPRDSGKMHTGVAEEGPGGDGRIAITIDGKTYSGTWVQTSPGFTHGWVSGFGFGGRRGGFGGLGGMITMDNPQGTESKALLAAPDGSGLRCDLRGAHGRGGGVCRDDSGREYDVQFRASSNVPQR